MAFLTKGAPLFQKLLVLLPLFQQKNKDATKSTRRKQNISHSVGFEPTHGFPYLISSQAP